MRNWREVERHFPRDYFIFDIDEFGTGPCTARTAYSRRMLKTEAEGIIYLDDDCLPTAGTIKRMIELEEPVVSALVPRCSKPHNPPIRKLCKDGLYRELLEFPWETPFTVDLVGSGCLYVAREVLEKIPEPWWTKVHIPEYMSEDYHFSLLCKQYGYQPWVHPKAWCNHIRGGYVYTMNHFKDYQDKIGRWMHDCRLAPRPLTGPVFRSTPDTEEIQNEQSEKEKSSRYELNTRPVQKTG